MSIESKLEEWLKQPGTFVTDNERLFIEQVRLYARQGVGYGWMQQVIEWEWQEHGPGAWGPEYFDKKVQELEGEIKKLRGKRR